jgi:integrase
MEDVRGFRDVLVKLPKSFTTLKEFAGKTLAEIAEMSPSAARLGAGTLQKYFACVRSFLAWCETEGYVTVSPAGKIKTGAKPNLYNAREPFSKPQLKTLFGSPQYVGHLSATSRAKAGNLVVRDGKFWVPLIGLCSGMRLGEIVQLLVSDIREDGGLTYFDVNDEGAGKTLKTGTSKRAIPVHAELVKVGFLDFVEARRAKDPNGRLFPEIKVGANNYASHNFSKYFGRYLKQVQVKTEKTAFHSFRHSFTDALREAGIEDSHIKGLLGHADASVTAGYGSGVPLNVLAGDMVKVEFDLDLSFLYLTGNK